MSNLSNLNNSVSEELKVHVLDRLDDQLDQEKADMHHRLFNEDYYIVGYYQAREWLRNHDIDAFEAIQIVVEYEKENFGQTNTDINSEAIVNMLAYILGEEIVYGFFNELCIDNNGYLDSEELEQIKEHLRG